MENEILVRIKTLTGNEQSVTIGRSASVAELKAKIEPLTSMPVNQQRIIFQGRCLEDNMTLSSAGLDNNSVVHVVERAPPTSNPPEERRSQGKKVFFVINI